MFPFETEICPCLVKITTFIQEAFEFSVSCPSFEWDLKKVWNPHQRCSPLSGKPWDSIVQSDSVGPHSNANAKPTQLS
jgi:hypothetical protein